MDRNSPIAAFARGATSLPVFAAHLILDFGSHLLPNNRPHLGLLAALSRHMQATHLIQRQSETPLPLEPGLRLSGKLPEGMKLQPPPSLYTSVANAQGYRAGMAAFILAAFTMVAPTLPAGKTGKAPVVTPTTLSASAPGPR